MLSGETVVLSSQVMLYLVEIENQIQFADIAEVVVQDLYKKVYALQIRQLVVCDIHAKTEEKARVSSVDDLIAFVLKTKTCSEDARWK